MSIRTKLFKGGVLLSAGQVLSQMCTFLRSVILARLISPEDFGIAATFAMTFTFIEMASNLSAQTLLVQAPDGDNEEFQSCGHALLAFRGFTNAVVLLLLAWPLAYLFGVPQARWAFYCIAAIPFLRGLMHLDLSRYQRNMRFGPQTLAETASNVAVTLACWPLAHWLRSYAAMLWVLLLQAVLYSALTHVMAERPYFWRWHREYGQRFLRFGWPLLINGILLFGILQGDRFVIGISRNVFKHSIFTLADLGVWSVAFSLVMVPGLLFSNVASSLFLPALSRVASDKASFQRRYDICILVLAFFAGALAVLFILGGRFFIPWIYGAKYMKATVFIGWIGVMWGMRVFRSGPTLAALAMGDSQNSMIANLWRSAALVAVVVVAATGGSLATVAVCGTFGEFLSLVVCVSRLAQQHHVPLRGVAVAFLFYVTLVAVAVLLPLKACPWPASAACLALLLLVYVTAFLVYSRDLRYQLLALLENVHLSRSTAGANL